MSLLSCIILSHNILRLRLNKLLKIFTLLLFITTLNAQYLRTIRIGSFVQEDDAQTSLIKIKKFIQKHENIILLENNYDFEFAVRQSGKHFITYAEPFRDKEVLQEVLDTLRLEYDDIYVTKLKPKEIEVALKPKEMEVILKPKVIEVEVKKELVLPTPLVQETAPKKVEVKIEEKIVPLEIKKSEITYNNLWKYLFFILFIVFLYLVRLLMVAKKERDTSIAKEIITQGKLSQTILEVKKKEKFLSYASHELRTPMTAIIGLTHLVLENDLNKSQQDYVQKIEVSAQHLLNIVNDILDISKLEEAEIKIEKAEFNINDIVENTINIVAMQAKNNNVNITLDIEEDVPSLVVGDSLRLGQILINLLSNSVKFTKDGEVGLTVKKLASFGESVTLDFVISDTGIGMTPDQVRSIFETYSQADDSTSRKYGGTGLGLAISKQLVELMNGKIKVSSKKEVGSTFSFYVDFHLKDAENKRQYRLPSSKLLNKRVLIVESATHNVVLLSKYMTYFNYKVNAIPSFDGVVFDKETQYDIVIVNYSNLTKSALSFIRDMQNKHKFKIVVLKELYDTSHNKVENNLIIDSYLKIPFTQQNVLNMIVELYVTKNLNSKSSKINIKSKLKEISEKRVLVVEDNELNHKVISGLLSDTNISLTFAVDGQEAVDLVLSKPDFDLVLMDINMPIMNGYEATKEIRKHKEHKGLPILALTADAMEESIEKALSSGMQGYITKPIIIDIFYKKILDIFNAPKVKINNIKSIEAIHSEGYEELSIEVGLGRCDNDKEFYRSILKDFKIMYTNSALTLEELCKEGRFKEARIKAMDMKDVSLNIGAYNLCEHAATMEYEFEKGERSHWDTLIELYTSSLEKLFKDIDKYIKNS